jgi:hypothetical protein
MFLVQQWELEYQIYEESIKKKTNKNILSN